MPRRAAAVRREVQPDAVYNNRLVTQLINKVLLDGKKSLAERIVYGAFDIVAEKTQQDALSVLLLKSWMPPRTPARLSRSVKTSTRWPNPTVRSRTIVGRA